MSVEDRVREHYRRDDLVEVVARALEEAGLDLDALKIDDLVGLDQLHAGFLGATEHLLGQLDVSPSVALLDVGSGAGGPARVAADRHGCRVTGIDLSSDLCAVARFLTERLHMTPMVEVETGSASDLPFDDASFDRAMMNHVGMNLADKATVFGEVRRVLVPDGLFAVYEQMRLGPGELEYPMPWADDESSSFVETREDYAEMLASAGFAVELDEDRTAANAAAGPPAAGGLTPAAVFGPGFAERIGNNVAAAMAGTLGAVLMVARAT